MQHLPKNPRCPPPPNPNIINDNPCSTVYQKHKCMCNTIYLCPLRYASVHTPNTKMKSNKCDSDLLAASAHLSQLCSILAFISQWFAYRNFCKMKVWCIRRISGQSGSLSNLAAVSSSPDPATKPFTSRRDTLNDSWLKFGSTDKLPSYLEITFEEYYLYWLALKKNPTNCCNKLVHNNKQQYQFISVPSLSTSKAPGALNNRVKINTA